MHGLMWVRQRFIFLWQNSKYIFSKNKPQKVDNAFIKRFLHNTVVWNGSHFNSILTPFCSFFQINSHIWNSFLNYFHILIFEDVVQCPPLCMHSLKLLCKNSVFLKTHCCILEKKMLHSISMHISASKSTLKLQYIKKSWLEIQQG